MCRPFLFFLTFPLPDSAQHNANHRPTSAHSTIPQPTSLPVPAGGTPSPLTNNNSVLPTEASGGNASNESNTNVAVTAPTTTAADQSFPHTHTNTSGTHSHYCESLAHAVQNALTVTQDILAQYGGMVR